MFVWMNEVEQLDFAPFHDDDEAEHWALGARLIEVSDGQSNTRRF
jgi:hypothetical protein